MFRDNGEQGKVGFNMNTECRHIIGDNMIMGLQRYS